MVVRDARRSFLLSKVRSSTVEKDGKIFVQPLFSESRGRFVARSSGGEGSFLLFTSEMTMLIP